MLKVVFFLVLSADEALFCLSKHEFPPAKWKNLANGLKLAAATSTIEANAANVDGCLHALIIHWVANDPGATWQNLVEAVRMSNEKVIAEKLSQDIGASSTGTD